MGLGPHNVRLGFLLVDFWSVEFLTLDHFQLRLIKCPKKHVFGPSIFGLSTLTLSKAP